jgi:hypothetical protein
LVKGTDGQAQLIAGQCCYTCAEFSAGAVAADNIHDETYQQAAAETIGRLRRLDIAAAHFSRHDRSAIEKVFSVSEPEIGVLTRGLSAE